MAKEEYKSTYEKLLSIGHKPKQDLQKRKIHTCKDQGAGATYILNDINRHTVEFIIDNGLITDTNSSKCDTLLMVKVDEGDLNSPTQSWVQFFIELKGSEVLHAFSQIEIALKNQDLRHSSNVLRYGRIVHSGRIHPSIKRDIEKRKQALNKNYKCIVDLKKSNQPDSFKRILEVAQKAKLI